MPDTPFDQRPTEYFATLASYAGLYMDPGALESFEIIARAPARDFEVRDGKAIFYGHDAINEAEWRIWVDERQANQIRQKKFEAEVEIFETTEEASPGGVMWGPVLAEPVERAPEMIRGYLKFRNRLCMSILSDPATLAITGSPMFHSSHVHLDKKRGTFDNIVDMSTANGSKRVSLGEPHIAEVEIEFRAARNRLQRIGFRKDDLNLLARPRNEGDIDREVVQTAVIVQDEATKAVFQDLFEDREIRHGATRTSNKYRGRFFLLEYGDKPAGSPYFMIRASPEGPRPTMYGAVQRPSDRGLEFEEKEKFNNRWEGIKEKYGMRGAGAVRGGFAETVVRVDPAEA